MTNIEMSQAWVKPFSHHLWQLLSALPSAYGVDLTENHRLKGWFDNIISWRYVLFIRTGVTVSYWQLLVKLTLLNILVWYINFLFPISSVPDFNYYSRFQGCIENSADPDQLASIEASWSGSTLFSKEEISGFSRTRVNPLHIRLPMNSDMITSNFSMTENGWNRH